MASSLALKRLVSSNILPNSLRVAIAPSTSRLFNTNAATPDDHDDRRRADGFFSDLQGRRQGAKKDVFDPLSPTRSLNMMDQVKGNRFLSTSRDIPGLGSEAKESNLRPLSPHLPIYKPQLSATLSITNRISGVFLTTALFKTCPTYRINCCIGRFLSSVLWGSSFIGGFFGKAEVKNGEEERM
ncbi:23.6 kDa heat shock, mitochondrial -like protein [Gossypium arboreum]|uniref:23.6 kDa heat shock, mitochondrial-like protein n=1 Tax=Gossypium arboreum TaxID=29729 RepID=A0A0B0N147_GOSAR|nr:23.6 kDa heat shock, mitochondrial -like protein [Gossypium arboreum]KHG06452.1 23.6 kDa heat shock, mitochondrial -like protein [Gossypium arboreum]